MNAQRSWRRPTGDDGVTLPETLVAVVVGSIVMGAAAMMFNVALQSNATTEARVEGINQARVAVQAMSRSLRTAVLPSQLDDTTSTATAAFMQGNATAVSFYANIDNPGNTIGPSRVTYSRSADGDLLQTTQQPDPHLPGDYSYTYCDLALGPATCPRRTQLLASGVDAAAGIFTYYDSFGVALPLTANGGCSTSAPCLDSSLLTKVDAVEVRVQVESPSRVAIGPSTFVTRVALPNNDAIIREESS